jgi:hypothetical protein
MHSPRNRNPTSVCRSILVADAEASERVTEGPASRAHTPPRRRAPVSPRRGRHHLRQMPSCFMPGRAGWLVELNPIGDESSTAEIGVQEWGPAGRQREERAATRRTHAE